jgi:predicted nucleotidyltransferase
MEKVKEKLGEYKYTFLNNFQNYLDTELIFFGSIQRSDFFTNSSDIDIIIISDNVKSILSKIQYYLHIDKKEIKKIYQQYSLYDKGMNTGYKIKYKDIFKNIEFDLLVYDEKYRKSVMQNVNDINNLPFYIISVLYILKYLHYTLQLIRKSVYNNWKCLLFHWYFNKKIKFYDKEHSSTIILDDV